MTQTTDQPQTPEVVVTEKPAEKDDVLGILSLVASLSGFAPVGFVLGLIGASQAKKEGRSPALARTGWIIGLVFMVVFTFLIVTIVIIALVAQNNDKNNGPDIYRDSSSSRIEAY